MSEVLLDEFKQLKDQFRAFGLPPGARAPNPERAAGLELLRQRRKDAGPALLKDERGESWGCAMVCIPMLDYQVLLAGNPELGCKDRTTRNLAWHKLFRDYGHIYGVDASVGKRQRNTGIVVK